MDDLERELRDLTEGRAGEPLFLEPSAAERARTGGVEVKQALAPPAGARTLRLRRLSPGGRQRLYCLLAMAILLAGGVLASLRTGRAVGTAHPAAGIPSLPQSADGGTADGGSAAESSQLATFSPAYAILMNGPPTDPFTGTRADGWANGAAGIVAPAARPAGQFTASQVAAAYAMTRKLLIASALDHQTLLGGQPTAFARLLTAAQRATFLAGLRQVSVTKNGYPRSTRTWVVSFAPGTTELIGIVIKTHGTMSARVITESGRQVLTVKVSYLFAYAVQPPHHPADWTQIVVLVQGGVDFVPSSHPGRAPGALDPRDRMVAAGPRCSAGDGYIYPDYPGASLVTPQSAGLVIAPYAAHPGVWPDVGCSRAGGI